MPDTEVIMISLQMSPASLQYCTSQLVPCPRPPVYTGPGRSIAWPVIYVAEIAACLLHKERRYYCKVLAMLLKKICAIYPVGVPIAVLLAPNASSR